MTDAERLGWAIRQWRDAHGWLDWSIKGLFDQGVVLVTELPNNDGKNIRVDVAQTAGMNAEQLAEHVDMHMTNFVAYVRGEKP